MSYLKKIEETTTALLIAVNHLGNRTIEAEDILKDVERLLDDYDKEGQFYGNLFSHVMAKVKKFNAENKRSISEGPPGEITHIPPLKKQL